MFEMEIEIVLWSSKNVLPNVRLFDEIKCLTEIEIVLWSSKNELPNVRLFDETNVGNGNRSCFYGVQRMCYRMCDCLTK